MLAEDEDFRDGDGVKPTLDPAPDGGKEVWSADYLEGVSTILLSQWLDAYKYPI